MILDTAACNFSRDAVMRTVGSILRIGQQPLHPSKWDPKSPLTQYISRWALTFKKVYNVAEDNVE
jgi:hypothetical protein